MDAEWWRGGVIYQIYPRSFFDSNNDGVGDLGGVAAKLDYIKNLGVDGIWLSPFFPSPMKDFGYDVSHYRDVDPIFGSVMDFDHLVDRVHGAGMRIIIDQVYSHTSDKHPWFEESRLSRDNSKSDWYVWANAKPDGGPPNNWISLFGGQAWSWDTRRKQYYMHNFLSEQPDLNFHCEEVQQAILEVADWWLERGVDGFRLDVANFYYCDRELRDNPPKRAEGGYHRPYTHQQHLYDRSQPENLVFLGKLRKLVDQYPDRMTVAEIGSDSYVQRSMEYTSPQHLHTAYNFLFLENAPLTPRLIRSAFEDWSSDDAWPSWSFSNHDVIRVRDRWGGQDASIEFAEMLLGLLMTLRGTIFLYQGEELGLPQAYVPFDKLQDPEGIRFWPESLGRDGCRTPIPWRTGVQNAGFSSAEPWLPVDPRHEEISVEYQEQFEDSTLNKTRQFIEVRSENPALRLGTIRFLDVPDPAIAFFREHENDIILCIFNLEDEEMVFDIPQIGTVIPYGLPGMLNNRTVTLPPFGGILIRL
ncbi:alpha-glucosidase family protein [Parvularcula sp. LCG005]|uniref:alpha-glucosidase family protein n=1 Tax=Parvularcula sp. LCG005 TaxID=3078805 RepID=UPI002943E239|nr:alpha-glucosidase family protein [Parvularcula sp. LCG005]WOI54689.1 alpha-glucosidase family protein [Parvularcula sp. LCG005]